MSTKHLYPAHRWCREIKVSNDGCSLTLTPRGSGYIIFSVFTHKHLTGRGYARRLMNRVMKWAKARSIRLELSVGAFAHATVPNEELRRFYLSVGFTPLSGPYMEFNPNGL